MKSGHVAAFFIALLIGGLFALSLFSLRDMQKLEAGPLVKKAIDEPQRGEELAKRAGQVINGDGTTGFALARWLVAQGKPELATVLLQEVTASKEGKKDALAWAGLAWAAGRSGNQALRQQASTQARRQAEEVLTRLNKAKPGDAVAQQQFQNAGAYFSARELGNEPQKAITALRESLRLATKKDQATYAQALNTLGYVLADRGESPREFDEAVTLTRQALQLASDNPLILDSYGWALYKQGKDLPAARRTLRAAVDLALDEAELRYHLAAVCAKMGLKDEAKLELDRTLKLAPTNEEAQALQAALEQEPSEAAPKAKP